MKMDIFNEIIKAERAFAPSASHYQYSLITESIRTVKVTELKADIIRFFNFGDGFRFD